MSDPISPEWLSSVGFKWHQLDRQPDKHWLLWIGNAVSARDGSLTSYEDLGIEIAPGYHDPNWFCWLRSDGAGRYHRFIHLRHISEQSDLIKIAEALSGQAWDPQNHINGSMMSPAHAAKCRAEWDRLDRKFRRDGYPWSEPEKDETMGGALPEHLEAHLKSRKDRSEAR